MLDLVIILCRYVFVFLAALFILISAVFVMNERGITKYGAYYAIPLQRIIIIVFNLLSFLILSVDKDSNTFNFDTVLNAAAVLVFVITAIYSSRKIYKNSCMLLWNGVFFITSIGFVMLQRLNPELLRRQMMFYMSGYVLMLLLPLIFKIIPRFEKLEFMYLALGLFLLCSIFVPGLGAEEFGASNWVKIGSISFQPSEFVKILYVFFLASTFVKIEKLLSARMITAVISSMVIVFMLVMQKDLGGALLFFMTFIVLFYITAGRPALILLALAVAACASSLAYYIFPHIQVRVSAWINPWADIDYTGYQITQSLFAITTYGLFGSGLSLGLSKTIPVVERDMIFAAVCEEFGGIFGIMLIAIYGIVLYRGVHIALRCEKKVYCLLSIGITSILAFQTFIIIGGVIKLIPLTGVTLPFVSYGGSSIFVSVVMIGILQWIYTKTHLE